MRVGLVREVGLSMLALAMAGLTACNDNPLDYNVGDTDHLETNPSVMVVTAGDTTDLVVRAVDKGNEPTFDQISTSVDGTCAEAGVTTGAITVVDNPNALPIQPPGQFLVLGGTQMGQTCIDVSGGGASASVGVTVVGASLVVVSAPETMRSGETATMDIDLVGADGVSTTPFDQATDVAWSSDNQAAVTVDDAGNLESNAEGTAVITAEWSGTDATGTSDLGVTRTIEQTIVVGASTPDHAELTIGEPLALGDVTDFEVQVFDANGNTNTNADEITGVTVTTSDPLVATVTGALVSIGEGQVSVVLTITAVGAGTADISGVVQTTQGDIPFGPTQVEVLAPDITSVTPASGAYGITLTLGGTGLSSPNFPTEVYLDGTLAGTFTVNSATDISVPAPTYSSVPQDVDITVVVGGVESNLMTYTMTTGLDADASKSNDPGVPTVLTLPFAISGVTMSPTDLDHFWLVTVDSDQTVIIDMSWDTAADFDILVTDAAFTAYVCTDGATGANPEKSTCDMAAGSYLIWINDYSEESGTYNLSAYIQ